MKVRTRIISEGCGCLRRNRLSGLSVSEAAEILQMQSKAAAAAVKYLHPYAVDVSSGIEKDGRKEKGRMAEFAAAVRKEEGL